MIDSTIIRAHQRATTGQRGGQVRARERFRGGLTIKIHMLADALGRPLRPGKLIISRLLPLYSKVRKLKP